MPIRDLDLTDELGERENKAKLEALRAAIAKGDAGGSAEGNVFARVRAARLKTIADQSR